MSALLRAELLKLRTTRTFVSIAGVTLVLSLLATVLQVVLQHHLAESDVRAIFYSDFTPLFMALLGIMGMAGEWRHRTITSTVLAAPRRLNLLAAKTLSYAVAGAVLSLFVTVLVMIVGSVLLSALDKPTLPISDLADLLWRNVLIAALLGAFGVGIGGIVRNQVVALIGLLLMSFVVEFTLFGVGAESVARFGPTRGAPAGIIGLTDSEQHFLAPGIAILVMLGWVALAFAATAVTLRRRDLV
ncbi:MAG: type transport system permease protein [Solirubrobacteraceae bacterium]|jgi:ABC-2 type transport system permease protein|nr:type transport system permease protein [Solirubrobacteraceae bacterium]